MDQNEFDQAYTLRNLMKDESDSREIDELRCSGVRLLNIGSAVKGLGKSSMILNLARTLVEQGKEVLLVDGDCSDEQLEDLLNVRPSTNFSMLLDGNATIDESVLTVRPRLHLLPASSGLVDMQIADRGTRERLMALLEEFPRPVDVILLDSAQNYFHPVLQNIMILTPEEEIIAATAQSILHARQHCGVDCIGIAVNHVTDGRRAQEVFKRLEYHLSMITGTSKIHLTYLGHIPNDEKLNRSVNQQQFLVELYPRAQAVPCFQLLAKRLVQSVLGGEPSDSYSGFRDEPISRTPRKLAGFWKTLLGEVRT